jgi:DNA-binding Lrp family transcriptional regulator
MKALGEMDRAILAVLTNDPFATNAMVAEKLGVSASIVAGRVRAMEREKVSQVLAVLDLKRMNQSFCFVHIQIRNRPVTDVAAEISTYRLALMISEFGDGTADLLVLVRYSDSASLNTILYRDIAKIEGVVRWRIDTVLSVPIFHSEYISFNAHYQPLSIEKNVAYLKHDLPLDLCDEIDLNIIAHLQQNAHQSINNVARKVGIKPSTARYRINNLKSSNILRFVRVIDRRVSGASVFTLAELSIDLSKMPSIIEALDGKYWLPQLFVCAGSSALVGIIHSSSAEETIRIRREELLAIPGVEGVALSHLLKTHMSDNRWAQEPSDTHADSPTATPPKVLT